MAKPLPETGKHGGDIWLSVDIGNVEIAQETVKEVCKAASPHNVEFSLREQKGIKQAVVASLCNEEDDQGNLTINPGSSNIFLHCSTDKIFLDTLADCETGKMNERFTEEFLQVGFKVEELKVEITNIADVNEIKGAITKRYHRYLKKN